jgi:hypothetical protein
VIVDEVVDEEETGRFDYVDSSWAIITPRNPRLGRYI